MRGTTIAPIIAALILFFKMRIRLLHRYDLEVRGRDSESMRKLSMMFQNNPEGRLVSLEFGWN